MGDDNGSVAFWIVLIGIACFLTAANIDISIDTANKAQELCIKANSKAISFDRLEVTCENNAVIPLNKE